MKNLIFWSFCFWMIGAGLEACPRCIEASPYRTGLFWAVVFLLPIPFVLAGWVFFWIRRASQEDFPSF